MQFIKSKPFIIITIILIIATALFSKYGFSKDYLIYGFYSSILLAIALSDWEKHIIPNKLVLLGAFSTIIISFLFGDVKLTLLGGVLGLLFMFLPVRKFKMGVGDAKLGLLSGMMVGYPIVAISIAMPWILSVFILGPLFLLNRISRKDKFPFGVFICAGTILTFLWGGSIWQLIAG